MHRAGHRNDVVPNGRIFNMLKDEFPEILSKPEDMQEGNFYTLDLSLFDGPWKFKEQLNPFLAKPFESSAELNRREEQKRPEDEKKDENGNIRAEGDNTWSEVIRPEDDDDSPPVSPSPSQGSNNSLQQPEGPVDDSDGHDRAFPREMKRPDPDKDALLDRTLEENPELQSLMNDIAQPAQHEAQAPQGDVAENDLAILDCDLDPHLDALREIP